MEWKAARRFRSFRDRRSRSSHRSRCKDFEKATAITAEVKSAIARMSAFAPLHNRAELEGSRSSRNALARFSRSPCSIPAFTADCAVRRRLPGPYEWLAQGFAAMGFHGINHEYCAGRTAQLLGRICRPETRDLPLGKRLFPCGHSRRPQHRYDHGFTPLKG